LFERKIHLPYCLDDEPILVLSTGRLKHRSTATVLAKS
jgi:hypothetical protein